MTTAVSRPELVQRGLWLNYLALGYNSLEAIVSVTAGLVSGSVALVGFGVDSCIEVTSSVAAQWRLRVDHRAEQRARSEHLTRRIIGFAFLALALYVTLDSMLALWRHDIPQRSIVGMVILTASVVVMPLLATAKRKVAQALASRALESDARQTSLCAYLSAIALVGVALNAFFSWWWADPACALGMVPIIAKEGWEGINAKDSCDCR